MNYFFRSAILLFAIFASADPTLAQSPSPTPPVAEVVKIPSPAYGRALEESRLTKKLLQERDTVALEAQAARLRASRETLDGGTSFISRFYDAIIIPDEEPAQAEAIAFFEKWAQASPKSITAQVALAYAYTRCAWNARGSGWGSTVTDKGWKLFEARLDQSRRILELAQGLEEKCPGRAYVAQTVALGQGWNHEEYMELVDGAMADEPTFGEYTTKACYWLLPRWYGEEGAFESWIASRADAFPAGEADRQYARMVWMADRMPVSDEIIFAPGRLDWARTQRGFTQWLEEMPDNLMVRLEYIHLALLANDRTTVRQQFEITGPKIFPAMWNNEEFNQAWSFAFADGPNPLLAQKKAQAPRFSPEIAAKIALASRLLAHLTGGLLVGLLLLVLALQRSRVWPGLAALATCVVCAGFLGTAATALPAAVLWLHLRRQPEALSRPTRHASAWWTLAGLVVMIILHVTLQTGAILLGFVPEFAQGTALPDPDVVFKSLVSDGSVFLMLMNSFWITFLLLLVICLPQNRESWCDRLGLHVPALKTATLWFVLGAVVIISTNVLCSFIPPDETTLKMLEVLSAGRNSPLLFLLTLTIIGPVFEELLFRGYVFSGWIDKIGIWGTTSATALLFALSHLQYGWSGLLFVFILGLVLGVMRWKTRSIYPGLVLHSAQNLLFCLHAFGFHAS